MTKGSEFVRLVQFGEVEFTTVFVYRDTPQVPVLQATLQLGPAASTSLSIASNYTQYCRNMKIYRLQTMLLNFLTDLKTFTFESVKSTLSTKVPDTLFGKL